MRENNIINKLSSHDNDPELNQCHSCNPYHQTQFTYHPFSRLQYSVFYSFHSISLNLCSGIIRNGILTSSLWYTHNAHLFAFLPFQFALQASLQSQQKPQLNLLEFLASFPRPKQVWNRYLLVSILKIGIITIFWSHILF